MCVKHTRRNISHGVQSTFCSCFSDPMCLRVPHSLCRLTLEPGTSLDKSGKDGARKEIISRQRGPNFGQVPTKANNTAETLKVACNKLYDKPAELIKPVHV